MNGSAAMVMGILNRGKERKVFDWDTAAKIIKDRGIKNAGAGLQGDLGNTEGTILTDGKPVADDYTYLASTWATPVLVNYDDDYEEIPCFVMESKTEWGHKTKWPQSAIDILTQKEEAVCEQNNIH